jgi:2-hydroxy-6-oxonona-2,4-dienedioate hydrolase
MRNSIKIPDNFETYFDEGKGQPIILLHGLFGNLSNWENVAKEFSKDYRVIIPRLPLFDISLRETQLNKLVTFLDNFIKRRSLKNIILMGNSLGGHIGLLYTLEHPENISKIILAGSSGLFENSLGGSFPRMKDYEYVSEKVKYTFYNKEVVTKELVDEVYETVQSRTKTLSLIGLARAAQKENLSDVLDQIKTPTLLIWGLQDEITPPETALAFHDLIPDSQLKFLDQCGHVPMMEQPAFFNQFVREFLSE